MRRVSLATALGVALALVTACTSSTGPTPAGACKAAPAPPTEKVCRTASDCDASARERCYGPGKNAPTYEGVCGVNCDVAPTPLPCQSDMQCAVGSRCGASQSFARCCGGPVTVVVCTAGSCLTGPACASDERCRSDGRCEKVPCTEGYTCPSGRVCDPSANGSDMHGCREPSCGREGIACPENTRCTERNISGRIGFGCEAMTCTDDSDCDCGACFEGRCATSLGTCQIDPGPPP